MAKTKSRISVFDGDIVEATRTGVSGTSGSGTVLTRLYRGYVWAAVLLLPFALLGVIVTSVASSGGHPTHRVDPSSTATSSAGRTAATLELRSWLAAAPSPLPGGQILSWDGAVVLPPATAPLQADGSRDEAPATYKTELDSFTLIDSHQHTYTATVQVALDPRGGGAEALSGPSLAPTVPAASDSWTGGGPWPGLDPVPQVPNSVQTAITGWVNAYTSGSADALRLAVGDTSSRHTYLPLTGVASATATATAGADYGRPGAMIVQVQLDIVWQGQKPATDGSGGDTSDTPQTTMDLLVERAGTAAPVVVAWGAPGSGPTLTPYRNAVTAPANEN